MEYRRLNIMLISAEGIKDMNLLSKMDVYAVGAIAGVPASKKRTAVHKDCGVSPKWNEPMEFVVDESDTTNPGHSIEFQIMAESLIRADKEIGTVTVPIHELFQANPTSQEKVVDYLVRTPSGKAKGTLKFSYSFGEKFVHEPETKAKTSQAAPAGYAANKQTDPAAPVTAYPAPYPAGASYQQHPGMGYPPPQYAAPPQMAYQAPPGGYGYPQPGGYGYQGPPPPQYGYPPAGYAVQQPQKPKKNKMGMGLGLGLGAGLLGGLLVGEAVSDIGEAAAYADGYDDAMGGFDF